jgi:hypothetical protein
MKPMCTRGDACCIGLLPCVTRYNGACTLLQEHHRDAEGFKSQKQGGVGGGKGRHAPHNDLVKLCEDIGLNSARRPSSIPENAGG